MHRRKFITRLILLSAAGCVVAACRAKKKIKGRIVGASSSVGHLLREKVTRVPEETETMDTVIVGGGVSGLSAAWNLQRNGVNNFALLELEEEAGGNAASGSNELSRYPWGAHYVPIPNNDLTEYLGFLSEAGVITGRNKDGLPEYNEYYLCFDPQERLYINGRWQEGLIPQFGVPDSDKKQIGKFLEHMESYRSAKGLDGKPAFTIPINNSSNDPQFTKLDNQTMKSWLAENGYTSEYLLWYVDYCTKDDFGTSIELTSAWVGVHYFASRKGKAANADHSDVLTWPEGNAFLVDHLMKKIASSIRTSSLVTSVRQGENGNIDVDYLDVKNKKLKRITASQCIIAAPQFIAARLLHDENRIAKVRDQFQYAPWVVANITTQNLYERQGAPPSWDNVIYGKKSLGYVVATHSLLHQHHDKKNLTWYLPLAGEKPAEERRIIEKTTHEEWVSAILGDLEAVHPNIASAATGINIMIWGHAMAQPLPGMIFNGIRKELGASIGSNIHFAHSDLAGVSIFEEAFYQGLEASRKVIENLNPKLNWS